MKIVGKLVVFSIIMVITILFYFTLISSLIEESKEENEKNSFVNEVSKLQAELFTLISNYLLTSDQSYFEKWNLKYSNHRNFLINNPLNEEHESAILSRILKLNNEVGLLFFEYKLSELNDEEKLQLSSELEEIEHKTIGLSFQLSELLRQKINISFNRYLVINNIFTVSILLIIFVYSVFIFHSFKTPFSKLKKAMSDIKHKRFSTRVALKANDEFKEIGDSFNSTIEALSKMESEHEQIDKVKTEFLSITSHELRSPMTPMQAQLQMLLSGYYGALNPKQSESIEIIYRNAMRLDNIIQDFLEISRIEAARLKFNFKKTSLKPSILSLVKEMSGFMPEKNIELKAEIANLPVIEVDPDRVMQVLRNLVNNAIKFSPSNSTITISASINKQMIELKVKDQGIGISKEDQIRIFEPFFQAEQSIYSHKKGTGLGLAIARGIVESQKGKIWIESSPNKGTTFIFTVPLEPVKEIEPIKLLFSKRTNISSKIRDILVKFLGPMGQAEFNSLAAKGVNQTNFIIHLSELKDNKIIERDLYSIILNESRKIFGEDNTQFNRLLDYKNFVKVLVEKVYSMYGSIAVSKANQIDGLEVDKIGNLIKFDIDKGEKILDNLLFSYNHLVGDLQKFIREKHLIGKLHKDFKKDYIDTQISKVLDK